MATNKENETGKGWRITFAVLVVVFLVLGSAFFVLRMLATQIPQNTGKVDWSSLTNTFSAASSLALIIISIIVALAALVQWPSLKADVRKEIEASQKAQKVTRRAMIMVQKRMEKLAVDLQTRVGDLQTSTNRTVGTLEETTRERVEALGTTVREQIDLLEQAIKKSADQTTREVRARAITIMGFLVGTLHSNPWKDFQDEGDKEYLAEVVYFCQKGYEDLNEISTEGATEGAYMALNNLVYYSTLLRLDEKSEILLEQARDIRNYVKNAKYASIYNLTFCRTVGTYGTDLRELKEALFLADQLSTSDDATTMTRKEATHVVALIQKRIEELARQTTGDPNRSDRSK